MDKLDPREIGEQQHEKLPAEHRGIPGKDPQPQVNQVGKQLTERDGSVESSLHLPHERDQSTSMTTAKRSPIIEQAFIDEVQGLEDTSKQPEMQDAYQKQK